MITSIIKKPEFWYAILPIVTAFIIYYLTLNRRSSRKLMLKLFKYNQKLSLDIQGNLKGFIEKHNAYNFIAFPEKDVTFGHFLEQMEAEFDECLSERIFLILKKKKLSKPELDSAIESLNKQNEALKLVDIDMKLVIRRADSRSLEL